MTNDILKLIKVVACIYYQRQSNEESPNLGERLIHVIQSVRVDGRSASFGSAPAAIDALRYTAEWMLNTIEDDSTPLTRDNILTRLNINLLGHNEYIQIATDSLVEGLTPEECRKRVQEILSELHYNERTEKLKSLINQAQKDINFSSNTTLDLQHRVKDLMVELEGHLSAANDKENPNLIGRIDFSNEDQIENVLQKSTKSLSYDGLLKTGISGIDKATGVGGLARGLLVNIGALTHNYKSGMLLDLALNIPEFNDPYMLDENKQPAIIRISFENSPSQDLCYLYQKLHAVKFKKKIDIPDINTKQAAKDIREHCEQRGYSFFLESYDPNNFSIYDLFTEIANYEDAGYEIHAILCDYLPLIAHNTVGDRTDAKIQKTYEMVRNHCNPKGITFITACQLSTEAQNLSREGSSNFVKKVAQGGWYMDCRSLHTKLDIELVLHIHEHIDGSSYLTGHIGKNRSCHTVKNKYKYFIHKFEDPGGIIPDFGQEERCMHSLPSATDMPGLSEWNTTEENPMGIAA